MTGFPDNPPPISLPAAHPGARIVLAIRGKGFGAEAEPTPAADATALSLVALLVFCVTCIVIAALLLKRRLGKQGPPNDLKTAEARTRSTGSGRNPVWQKPEDWWKH